MAFCLRASAALFLNLYKNNRLYHGIDFANFFSKAHYLEVNVMTLQEIKSVAKTHGIRGILSKIEYLRPLQAWNRTLIHKPLRSYQSGKVDCFIEPFEYFGFSAAIIDASDSGCCLLTEYHLCKDQVVVIQENEHLGYRKATVRWSKKVDKYYVKAGLEFMQP